MKKLSKKTLFALMTAAIVAASAPMMVMAMEEELDEDDVYADQVIAVAENEPVSSNLENSPAVRSNSTQHGTSGHGVTLNNDHNQTHNNSLTNNQTHNNSLTNNQTHNNTHNNQTHPNNTDTNQTGHHEIGENRTPQGNYEAYGHETRNPGTGAPSLAMPIGTALLSLGTVAIVIRKKK